MGGILLADDSAHAQRMGERILREEGFQVTGAIDGASALTRISETDPDLVIADVFLPGRDGFELCRYIKRQFSYMRVILTAGLLESLDENEARKAGCDAVLRKPFEASVVMDAIRPLVRDAQAARGMRTQIPVQAVPISDAPPPAASAPPPPDREQIEAAVKLALEAALPALTREITEMVLVALGY